MHAMFKLPQGEAKILSVLCVSRIFDLLPLEWSERLPIACNFGVLGLEFGGVFIHRFFIGLVVFDGGGNYSLGLSMISMIEGKDGSQKVAMAMAKAMAMAIIMMVRMVGKSDDVCVHVDGLLDVIDDIRKFAMFVEWCIESRKSRSSPMPQHRFSLNHSRKRVSFIFQ